MASSAIRFRSVCFLFRSAFMLYNCFLGQGQAPGVQPVWSALISWSSLATAAWLYLSFSWSRAMTLLPSADFSRTCWELMTPILDWRL